MRAVSSLLLLTLTATAGCGLRTYSERLQRTQRLQDYLELLNEELLPRPWRNAGLEIRVPRQFSSAPEEFAAKIGGDDSLPAGVRRLGRELRGVQAVWRGKVRVRGKSGRWPAYVVLVSNRDLTHGGEFTLKDAMQFEENLVEAIFHSCGQARPLRADWPSRELPADREFAIQRQYSAFGIPAGPAGEGGEPYRILAYCVNEGTQQFAVLFVLPERVANEEKLTEDGRIGLSLGTLASPPD